MLIRPDQLSHLTHHRWVIPALAEMRKMGGGARVAELLHRLGAHRLAVHQAIDQLIAIGLLEPNPGHGHPLRPEYLLTDRGERVADASARVVRGLEKIDATGVGFRKWTLPTTLALAQGASRFGEVRIMLVSATDRALSQCLLAMGEDALVGVRDSREDRRASVYTLKPKMDDVVEALSALPPIG